MRYEFKDVGTGEILPTDKQVSVIDLCQEHKYLFVYSTSVGDIILRKMPLRMRRTIDGMIGTFCPRYYNDIQRLGDIRAGIEDINNIPSDIITEVQEISARVAHATRFYIMGVMVSPVIYDDEDIDRLYSLLTAEECANLDMLISEMLTIADPSEIDDTALILAEKYNVVMVDKEMLSNLTISQANYFISRINRENDELMRAFRRNE